jgi:hypothetical protein
VAVVLVACGAQPVRVADTLANACSDARDRLATAPAPTDVASLTAFVDASAEAARAVARAANDVADRGDDQTIADLAWQLHRFPGSSGYPEEVLGIAHEASAAIIRIDRFAEILQVPECGAATWRPADWRALAVWHGNRPGDAGFRREIDRLCAKTFPNPSLLARGVPLLEALVADVPVNGEPDGVKVRVIRRLSRMTGQQSDAARFVREFGDELPQIQPSANLERRYLALLTAFMELESVVPRAMPRDPPPPVQERVGAALDDLERAWHDLAITC